MLIINDDGGYHVLKICKNLNYLAKLKSCEIQHCQTVIKSLAISLFNQIASIFLSCPMQHFVFIVWGLGQLSPIFTQFFSFTSQSPTLHAFCPAQRETFSKNNAGPQYTILHGINVCQKSSLVFICENDLGQICPDGDELPIVARWDPLTNVFSFLRKLRGRLPQTKSNQISSTLQCSAPRFKKKVRSSSEGSLTP